MSEAYDYNSTRDNPVVSVATAPATNEESVQENANMIRKGFEHILNKALEASDLARRVAELERQLTSAQDDIITLRRELNNERDAHSATQADLTAVQSNLAQRESTVHDLVMERDIALEERNNAQAARKDAEEDANIWRNRCANAQAELEAEQRRNAVLEERCNLMQQRVNAVKEAFNGLHSL